ncbi:hypothetical protein J3R83DRAFT_12479 [Lanmaoa asiatica]|nr:hypothetical protein J3R83DRAFT_12479 [Lanmaoa asiatica]
MSYSQFRTSKLETVSLGLHQHLTSSLNPKKKQRLGISVSADIFDGPGGDKAIVAEVVQEVAEKNNEVIEIDDDDDDEISKPDISRTETINLCEKLMEACLQHGDSSSDLPLNLLTNLRHFHVCLRRKKFLHARQTTLDAFLACPSRQSFDPNA